MLIEWNNKETLVLKTNDFSITNDFFKDVVHINIDFDSESITKKITKNVESWHSIYDKRDLIINHQNNFYLLETGYPKIIHLGMTSNIRSGDFVFKSMTDITRKYKINTILDS